MRSRLRTPAGRHPAPPPKRLDTPPGRGRLPRKILVLKGIVFGIPLKVRRGLCGGQGPDHGARITVCWTATSTPTRVRAMRRPPPPSRACSWRCRTMHLEFFYFKEEGKAAGLLHGIKEPKADKFGNVLGPFPFLTRRTPRSCPRRRVPCPTRLATTTGSSLPVTCSGLSSASRASSTSRRCSACSTSPTWSSASETP